MSWCENGTECSIDCSGNKASNCCQASVGVGCNDPQVQACVCGLDSWCCTFQWDSICASEVTTFGCGSCSAPKYCGWVPAGGYYDCAVSSTADPTGGFPKSCEDSFEVCSCAGKSCGDDGCGKSCGSCGAGFQCNTSGQCVQTGCTPSCAGKTCGPNGCGGSCGSCGAGLSCVAGTCKAPTTCYPDCSGKQCGDDGCGGQCGTCINSFCDEGICTLACTPKCDGKVCGADGCGGSCGKCAVGKSCVAGVCKDGCTPDCSGQQCGDNGCGGLCGTCPAGESCLGGTCTEDCVPLCGGKVCGPDGCGGECGTCKGGEACLGSSCIPEDCTPSCSGKACGSDGCGGFCGSCPSGWACQQGTCKNPCVPQCKDRVCGDDKCGGSCGTCDVGEVCTVGGECIVGCVPACDGLECGPDGCGGDCGLCGEDEVCTEDFVCLAGDEGSDTPGDPSGTFEPEDGPGGNGDGSPATCSCEGRECGDDGCGVSCGSCAAGSVCEFGSGLCAPISPGDLPLSGPATACPPGEVWNQLAGECAVPTEVVFPVVSAGMESTGSTGAKGCAGGGDARSGVWVLVSLLSLALLRRRT